MKRTAGLLVLLATLVGCVETNPGPYMAGYWNSRTGDPIASGNGCCSTSGMTTVPGVQGPWGQPVGMAAPYSSAPPAGEQAAREMLRQSMPLGMVQQVSYAPGGGGVVPAGVAPPPGGLTPPGIPGMPPTPAMGPNPGMALPMGTPRVPGAVAAVGALTGPGPQPFPAQRTEVFFTNPPGMKISWFAPTADGKAGFTPDYIETPGRYNFLQAAIYRLKLSDIPNLGNVDLYPTLEVVPANHKTSAFLAHSAVPVAFTDEDFQQVASGNYVVKVIYLPDPQFQDLATTGPSEVVSSRLDPGVDPLAEACRRGSILLVVRLGNIDLSLPHSPGMDAPSPYHVRQPQPPPGLPAAPGFTGPGLPGMPGMPGMGGPGGMMPNGMAAAGAGGMFMGPNGPMIMGPNGPMPVNPGAMPPPGTPPTMPANPLPAQPQVAPTPVTKLPDASTLTPVKFKPEPGPMPSPAALASQSSTQPPVVPAAGEAKSSNSSPWVIPGVGGK